MCGPSIDIVATSHMKFFGKSKSAVTPSSSLKGLSDSRQRFEIIINNIEDGVVLIDKDGTIRSFNPAASKISGWPIDEATGINIAQVMKLTDEKGEIVKDSVNSFSEIFKTGQTINDNNSVY